MSKIFEFFKNESGTTAIEYGLVAAGVGVVTMATAHAIGDTLNSMFNHLSN